LIRAAIAEDFFYLWSFPREQASSLVTREVSPLCFEGRAWLAVAAVRLRKLRWRALPVSPRATVAGLILLCEYRDERSEVLRGNYFLRAVSDSLLVSLAARTIRSDYSERARIGISPDGGLETPHLSLRLAEMIPPAEQARLDHLFRDNCSGIVRRRDRAFHSALVKDHWTMRGRRLLVKHFSWIDGLDLKPEFGFDCSNNNGCWSSLRPCLSRKADDLK
jgi:hypothetical protein